MFWLTLIFVFIVLKLITTLTNARCKSKVCLVGRTALITGGNSGIGHQLAKELASRGCAVIIADKTDASNTVRDLIKETHNSQISFKMVDFASFTSVRLFAEELKKNVSKLDILVNNVGIGVTAMKMSEDGIQEMMQINYFSHFLLIHLLLDLLLQSSPSRIIYTNSMAAYSSTLTENNIVAEAISNRKPLSSGPYANSKVAGAIMSKILANKLEGTGVTSNTFHPGLVKTTIWQSAHKNGLIMFYLWWAWALLFGKNTEEGIQTVLHLTCADEVETISGKFFMECRPVRQPTKVYDKTFGANIWNISEKLVQLKPEEKIEVIVERYKGLK